MACAMTCDRFAQHMHTQTNQGLLFSVIYSRTSMAQTSLGPWKYVLDMGSPLH